jgi:hypothetical protein
MDPMRFVATRLWAMRGSADRKTIEDKPPTDCKKSKDVLPLSSGKQSQESRHPADPKKSADTYHSGEDAKAPEQNIRKQPVQLTLF